MSNENAHSGIHMLRAVMAAIILANLVSCYGQVEWFFRDQHLPLIGAIGAAVSLESIALALSAMAHHAMIAGDSSWSLAGGSRGMSLVAGLINLSHYSPQGITHPSTLGIVFGLLSSSSGFMWGAYAKRQARDRFIEEGVIGKRTVRVGMPMWILYPKVALERMRIGVFYGENRLSEVRRLAETKRIDDEAKKAVKREAAEAIERQKKLELESREQSEQRERERIERERIDAENEARELETTIHDALESSASQAEQIRVALKYADSTVPSAIVAWLAQRGYNGITSANVRTVKNRERNTGELEMIDLHAV